MTFAFNHKFAGRAFGNPSQAQLSPKHNLMAINNFSTTKTNTNLHFRNAKSALSCKSRSRDLFLLSGASSSPLPPFLLRQIIMAERVGDAILARQVCLRFQICLCISLHMSVLQAYSQYQCHEVISTGLGGGLEGVCDWQLNLQVSMLYEEHDTGDAIVGVA